LWAHIRTTVATVYARIGSADDGKYGSSTNPAQDSPGWANVSASKLSTEEKIHSSKDKQTAETYGQSTHRNPVKKSLPESEIGQEQSPCPVTSRHGQNKSAHKQTPSQTTTDSNLGKIKPLG
jgi:hypothetical protein